MLVEFLLLCSAVLGTANVVAITDNRCSRSIRKNRKKKNIIDNGNLTDIIDKIRNIPNFREKYDFYAIKVKTYDKISEYYEITENISNKIGGETKRINDLNNLFHDNIDEKIISSCDYLSMLYNISIIEYFGKNYDPNKYYIFKNITYNDENMYLILYNSMCSKYTKQLYDFIEEGKNVEKMKELIDMGSYYYKYNYDLTEKIEKLLENAHLNQKHSNIFKYLKITVKMQDDICVELTNDLIQEDDNYVKYNNVSYSTIGAMLSIDIKEIIKNIYSYFNIHKYCNKILLAFMCENLYIDFSDKKLDFYLDIGQYENNENMELLELSRAIYPNYTGSI